MGIIQNFHFSLISEIDFLSMQNAGNITIVCIEITKNNIDIYFYCLIN